MSTRLTTRATTRRRARRRERRERYHHARIVSSSRVARARRRDDTSSASPRDDSARVRELIEFPPPVDTAPTRARRDDTRHTSHEILLTSRARSRANHRPHRAVPRPMARTTDNLRDRGSARPRARSPTNDRARRFPSDRRPIGDRTANEQKKARALASPRARSPRPRDARARVVPNCRTFRARARGGCTTKGTQW